MRKHGRENLSSTTLLALALAFMTAGCNGDDGDDDGAPPATSTPVATDTVAPTATDTATAAAATATPTNTGVVAATATPTNTGVVTETATPTNTAEVTATPTQVAATATPSATNTLPVGVDTPTFTPTGLVTDTPGATATPTPTQADMEVTPTPTATEGPAPVLRRASKSSAIAVTGNNAFVVMCNPDDDSVSIFQTGGSAANAQGGPEIIRVAKVGSGGEPVAVVIHPDDRTAFVANRADATVVRISNLGPGAVVSAPVNVGSEPTGLALSPTGAKLFVAEFAEGRVSVISTASMTVIDVITDPQNPRAVAVTNNGNDSDDDETLIVTEFFGVPANETECEERAGSTEACDIGRRGVVRLYNVSDHSPQPPRIMFDPVDSGFIPPGGAETVMTSPNQLYAAAIDGDRVYVTSVSASPEPPINFRVNVHPVVYVADLQTHQEVRTAGGTANLARLAEDALGDVPGVTDRFFLQELVDLDFVVGTQTAYAVSRAADAVQEIIFDSTNGVRLGLPQINLLQNVGAGPCQNPIGIAMAAGNGESGTPLAFVNCWLTERLAVIDVASNTLVTTVQSVLANESTQPAAVRRGKRFYFTGRGRWSEDGEGYSSCGSCHPDGLSDNITWSFAAGPRQTTAMDGTYSHGPGPQQHRILNWTGIFDELHDFERNTRGVSGGLGAITTSPTMMCGTLSEEQPFPIPADGLGQPIKELQDDEINMICTTDWDDIDEFVKTIRPPRALRSLDPEAVARGRALFTGDGACVTCHAGPGWTISRRYWTPSSQNNDDLKVEPFLPPTGDSFWPLHTVQIGAQPAAADNTGAPIAPNEVACVLRDVGTFGLPGDGEATDLIERKADAMRTRAQGAGGFNVPSLYGMSVGAPYLHHGQARSLHDLFTDTRWLIHLQAANPEFAPSEEDVDDLVSFVLSIDATTPEEQAPAPFDACPPVFPLGQTFRAHLSGDQEVPDPVVTMAVGTAVFYASEDEDAIAFELSTAGIEPSQILQAHIHAAPPGVNGDVIAFLAYSSFNRRLRGTVTASDLKLPNLAGINSIAELIDEMRTGDTYVNVHTVAHPGGEIRGQIELEE
jgi:cytochrome c peroxidase